VLAVACDRERDHPYDPIGGSLIGLGPAMSDAQAVMLASAWATIVLVFASFLISAVATTRSRPARLRYALATLALAGLFGVVAAFWPERGDYPDPANYRAPPLFLKTAA
jgi:hypothetical protein